VAHQKRISKEKLHELTRRADSITSLPSGFGTYDAVIWVDERVIRVTTESLNPIGDVRVEEINDDIANQLMSQ
jgi:hypothetical protein